MFQSKHVAKVLLRSQGLDNGSFCYLLCISYPTELPCAIRQSGVVDNLSLSRHMPYYYSQGPLCCSLTTFFLQRRIDKNPSLNHRSKILKLCSGGYRKPHYWHAFLSIDSIRQATGVHRELASAIHFVLAQPSKEELDWAFGSRVLLVNSVVKSRSS